MVAAGMPPVGPAPGGKPGRAMEPEPRYGARPAPGAPGRSPLRAALRRDVPFLDN